MDWLYALLLGYLLGSIPFGILLTRLTGAGDLRAIGSGNIGATNVLRTGRKGLAAATLLLDLGKGLAAVLIAYRLFPGFPDLAALGAVIGHCFPVWLKFRGGKGVATLMGVSLGLAWPIGLAYAVVWLGMLAIVRISSGVVRQQPPISLAPAAYHLRASAPNPSTPLPSAQHILAASHVSPRLG